MKDLGRWTKSVGGSLYWVGATRLIPNDPANDVRWRHTEPLGACLIDENDPPLIINEGHRLPERVEQPGKLLE
jgi:hypothetical protein